MQACYRKLRPYKYQLVEDYEVSIPIYGEAAEESFIKLSETGTLFIKKGYAWDGPSGPTFDTLTFMRGSLVHDALYQLIRMELLDFAYRSDADRIIRDMCLEDGMNRVRAKWVYWALRLFGGSAATPGSQKQDVVIRVPKGE